MRSTLFVLFLAFWANALLAQGTPDSTRTAVTEAPRYKSTREQTLFRNSRLTGGFGGPIFTYGGSGSKNIYGSGGGGGLVFDRFFIGGFGMNEYLEDSLPRRHPQMAYGGLWMGYCVPTNKVAHLFASVKLGAGAFSQNGRFDDFDDDDWEDALLVAIPEAGVELNVTRWFRVSGSVGYRFVDNFDGWQNYTKSDLTKPVYALTLRFGWF